MGDVFHRQYDIKLKLKSPDAGLIYQDVDLVVSRQLVAGRPLIRENRLYGDHRIRIQFPDIPWVLPCRDHRYIGQNLICRYRDELYESLADMLGYFEGQPDRILALMIQLVTGLKSLHDHQFLAPKLSVHTLLLHPQHREADSVKFIGVIPHHHLHLLKSRIHQKKPVFGPLIPDCRADFFAVGVLMMHIMGRKKPVVGPDNVLLCPRSEIFPPSMWGIVDKLTSRFVEDGYQSCQGILADLRFVQRALSSSNSAIFFPGQQDLKTEIRFDDLFFGRRSELKIIRSWLQDFPSPPAVLELTGSAGSGKTAMLDWIESRMVARFSKICLRGKRPQPHFLADWAQQLWGIFRRRVSQTRLKQDLGSIQPILGAWLPEEFGDYGESPCMGLQDPNLVGAAASLFLQYLVPQGEMVFVLIDDVDEIDPVSKTVLKTCISTQVQGVRWILTTRQRNALNLESDTHFQAVSLGPLDQEALEELVDFQFDFPKKERQWLVANLVQKSLGYPLYLGKVLKQMLAYDAIGFSSGLQKWTLNPDRIRQLPVAENVAALIIQEFSSFPGSVQMVLRLAAIFGHHFSLDVLSVGLGQDRDTVIKALDYAVQNHMIVQTHRHGSDLIFRFTQTAVHESIYDQFTPSQKQVIHGIVGRKLWSKYGTVSPPAIAIQVAIHICSDLGYRLGLKDIRLIQFLVKAARNASDRSGLALAYRFLNYGFSKTTPLFWISHPALMRDLVMARGQIGCRLGLSQPAAQDFALAIQHTRSLMDRATLFNEQANLYLASNQYRLAIQAAQDGLGVCHCQTTLEPSWLGIGIRFFRMLPVLLVSGPPSTELPSDRDKRLLSLYAQLATAAFFVNRRLFIDTTFRLLCHCKSARTRRYQGYALICLAFILKAAFGQGDRWGEKGRRLFHQWSVDKRLSGPAYMVDAVFLLHWTSGIDRTLDAIERARQVALSSGNTVFYFLSSFNQMSLHFYAGRPLAQTRKRTDQLLANPYVRNSQMDRDVIQFYQTAVKVLSTPSRPDAIREFYTEMASYQMSHLSPLHQANCRVLQLMVCVLVAPSSAHRYCDGARQDLKRLRGFYQYGIFHFFETIALMRCSESTPLFLTLKRRRRIKKNMTLFNTWRQRREDFGVFHELLKAEWARYCGKHQDAGRRFRKVFKNLASKNLIIAIFAHQSHAAFLSARGQIHREFLAKQKAERLWKTWIE